MIKNHKNKKDSKLSNDIKENIGAVVTFGIITVACGGACAHYAALQDSIGAVYAIPSLIGIAGTIGHSIALKKCIKKRNVINSFANENENAEENKINDIEREI